MPITQKISPFLWFDSEAEQAAQFYTGIFKNSRIVSVSRYPKAGFETHHMPEGTPMTVLFELEGQQFSALNGGPAFKFNEAISLMVSCNDQKEIDYYWEKLGAGGDPKAQQCGWLKDRFGLAWQITPSMMSEFFTGPNSGRVMEVMLKMKKLDIAKLREAAAGK
jgi:predicted 3-demethylubiquinone-9 3-methyltransferase (glyoxalase superfamily)